MHVDERKLKNYYMTPKYYPVPRIAIYWSAQQSSSRISSDISVSSDDHKLFDTTQGVQLKSLIGLLLL